MWHRVAKHKHNWTLIIYNGSSRLRRKLKASGREAAHAEADEFVADLKRKRPKDRLTVGQIVEMYLEQSEAIWRKVDEFHATAVIAHFGRMDAAQVGERECRDFCGNTKAKTGTIRKKLSILRAALRWAERKALIDKAPHIWLPPAPPPRDRRLTREEFAKLELAADTTAHLSAFIAIARFTAARAGAILSLTWGQVDFSRRIISLGGGGRQKRRAVVPLHPDLAWRLALMREAAETNHVIEWAGKPVKSIKNAFRRAVKDAGLGKEVTPHVLRHTAASWMAEAGVPMSEIAAVLGHSDSRVTEKHYAKYSPTYLQRAVRALG